MPRLSFLICLRRITLTLIILVAMLIGTKTATAGDRWPCAQQPSGSVGRTHVAPIHPHVPPHQPRQIDPDTGMPMDPSRVPMPPDTTPSDAPPSTTQDFADTPATDLAFSAPEPGLGSPDVAFAAPNIIGDFFGSAGSQIMFNPGALPEFSGTGATVTVPNPAASVVGRQKLAENTSPIPRDRVFLNYSYFDDVPLQDSGVGVHRLTPGIEKTFCDRMASFQIQFPMATTLDSDLALFGDTDDDKYEFGNINLALKGVLYQNETSLLTAGLAVTLPTADDLTVQSNGIDVIRSENEAVHLLPFLGVAMADPEGLFVQGVVQLDIDPNGNPILINNGNSLQSLGDLKDPTFLYADLSVGYWLMRDYSAQCVTGVAPVLELHYNRSLESSDTLAGPGGSKVGASRDIEVLNLVLGTTFELNNTSTLTLGYSTPLSTTDRQFDGEFRVLFNHYYSGLGTGVRRYVPNF